MSRRQPEIYSLGTSNRSAEEFLEILKQYKIQTVVDVRRWPTSQWFEYFKKENLKKFLGKNKIKYQHFKDLGGYRKGGYQTYTKTRQFKEALKKLVKLDRQKETVIICAEKLPWKCHRAYIAWALSKKFAVAHFIEKDKIWQPKGEVHKIKPLCQKFLIKK